MKALHHDVFVVKVKGYLLEELGSFSGNIKFLHIAIIVFI
jgi:hypothetical protein